MPKVSKERAAELKDYITGNLKNAGFRRDSEGNDHVQIYCVTTRHTSSNVHYIRLYVAYVRGTDDVRWDRHGAGIQEITHLVAEAYGQARGKCDDVRMGGGGYNKHLEIVGFVSRFVGVRCEAVSL